MSNRFIEVCERTHVSSRMALVFIPLTAANCLSKLNRGNRWQKKGEVLAGELSAIRAAIELAPVAAELGSAGARFAEELFLPATGRSATQIARTTGIVAKDLEFPIASEVAELRSSIHFGTNGQAQISDLLTRNPLSYRKSDDLFFLYEPGHSPATTSTTFRRGFLTNPGASGLMPLDRSKPLVAQLGSGGDLVAGSDSAHAWNRLTPKQLAAVNEAIPDGSIPVGLGSKRQAWFNPTNEQAVVLGPIYERPQVPNLLQPTRKEVIGDKQLEWFPMGESDSVTRADVRDVNHQIRLSGWSPDDSFTANYVRLLDGKVWRVDPEDLYRMSDRSWKEYLAIHK